jgi:hypothetical protein
MAILGVTDDYYDPVLVTDVGNPGDRDQPPIGYADMGYDGGGGDSSPVTVEASRSLGDETATQRRPVLDTQAIGPDGYYLDQAGNPTGNRPAPIETLAFQNAFPNGGSFTNPQAGRGGNMSVEDQVFQSLYPQGGSFSRGDFLGGDLPGHPNVQAARDLFGGSKPTLPDMTPAGYGAPAALAAGQGWFIDSHGGFHSDNEGANIRANRLGGPGDAFSLSPSTIISMGNDRNANPFTDLPTVQSYGDQGRRLPGVLGLTMGPRPTLPDMQGGGATTGGGTSGLPPTGTGGGGQFLDYSTYLGGGGNAPIGGNPYQNFNPRRGDTLQQTYGPFGATNGPGGGGGRGGGGGPDIVLPDSQRIRHGPNGEIYVTDKDGYMAPMQDALGNNWSSKSELRVNVLDPVAREKLQVLARLGDRDALTVLSGLPANIDQTQSQNQWNADHNAIVRRTGLGDLVQNIGNIPDAQGFPVEQALIQAMRADGMNVSSQLVNGNIAYTGTDGQPRYIPAWQAGQMLQDRAKLEQTAPTAPAATRSGGGGPRYSYTPPPAADPLGMMAERRDLSAPVGPVTGIQGDVFGTNTFGNTVGGYAGNQTAPLYDEFGQPFRKGYQVPA